MIEFHEKIKNLKNLKYIDTTYLNNINIRINWLILPWNLY